MSTKNVIIASIGTANPSVGKILSEVLGIQQEYVVKLLYCTPAVLFQNVEEELALKTEALLTKLGLEVLITSEDEPLPAAPELLELALYIQNPRNLPIINKQLSEFLGCDEKESLNLLLNEPSIVLGGVSIATALALSKRIDAEVIASNPKTDLYTLRINTADVKIKNQIDQLLHTLGLRLSPHPTEVEGLTYANSQEIWKRFQQTGAVQIINQSFQRFEIVLDAFDLNNSNHTNILTQIVGMPEEILSEIASNLPVVLDESVNRKDLSEKLGLYTTAGLTCSYNNVPLGKYNITIDQIPDLDKTKAIVKQFFSERINIKQNTKWTSPKPLQHILTRYMTEQLEEIGCVVEKLPA
ncbi:hypothetical protein DMB65_17840 [Flavobacterium cheongpyeongense]|uniref:Uncharacterized protein n=1 Tax=Flavobacterium cheongpyeongense TaxID=2212651 RepID=A0A2V4BK47_9FLAO|nr:hypothetical protein [Flavobacterium cheongpyeongense]PXY39348.1 hypothetical protein DMB65_17840 [Flavobacterium cheongpyeongense]